MARDKLILAASEAMYDAICNRANNMVMTAFPELGGLGKELAEASVAAGVTAAIQYFREKGLLQSGHGPAGDVHG